MTRDPRSQIGRFGVWSAIAAAKAQPKNTMNISIQPVEIDGQFYVGVSIGGYQMEPKGPYGSADDAERMSERLRAASRALAKLGGQRG